MAWECPEYPEFEAYLREQAERLGTCYRYGEAPWCHRSTPICERVLYTEDEQAGDAQFPMGIIGFDIGALGNPIEVKLMVRHFPRWEDILEFERQKDEDLCSRAFNALF